MECKNCLDWNRTSYWQGDCESAKIIDQSENLEDIGVPENGAAYADSSGRKAFFITHEGFGCVNYKAK